MATTVQRRPTSPKRPLAALSTRLSDRRREIEEALLTRVYGIASPRDASLDPEYMEGLRAAVAAALDYGLSAIERGEGRTLPPPPLLLAQARLAARYGVSVDVVLRRYLAGHSLFSDYLIEEAGRGELLSGTQLQDLLRKHASLFDRLLAAVSEQYMQEDRESTNSTGERLAERVERLLAGELSTHSEIPYDFTVHHIGLIATGDEAEKGIRRLAAGLDCRLLAVPRADRTTWAWLGSRDRPDPGRLQLLIRTISAADVVLAVGEPGENLAGWRLTHRQAKAALPIALRRSQHLIRYADAALLASVLNDDLLTTSLRQLYLDPLTETPHRGAVLRSTLQAYFAADRNISSAAARQGISRQALAKRLCVIEQQLGRSISSCGVDLEIAIAFESLHALSDNSQPPKTSTHHIDNPRT